MHEASTIVQARSTEKPTTIEQTAKSRKAHQLAGALIIVVGMLGLIADDSGSPGPAIIMFVGLVWFIAARATAWWHHG